MAGRPRQVVWTVLARDGLHEVLAYTGEDSPEAAEKVLNVVLGTAESLDLQVLASEVRILAFLRCARDFNRRLRES